jgi:hypothetical protein
MKYSKSRKGIKTILHPYLFVLKEGKSIHHNLLDYSLSIFQVTAPEILRSPAPSYKTSNPPK